MQNHPVKEVFARWVSDAEIHKVTVFEENDDEKVLTLFSSVRMIMTKATGQVHLFEKCHAVDQWEAVEKSEVFAPDLSRVINVSEDIMRNSIGWLIRRAAPSGSQIFFGLDGYAPEAYVKYIINEISLRSGEHNKDYNDKRKAVCRRLNEARRLLNRHFLDPDFRAAIRSLKYDYFSVNEIVRYSQNKAGFLKIRKEHPNMLPLTSVIHSRFWDWNELFAKRTWVGESSDPMVMEFRKSVMRSNGNYGIVTGETFNWMRKAHSTVLKSICVNFDSFIPIMRLLAEAKLPGKQYAYALRCIVEAGIHVEDIASDERRPLLINLVKAFHRWEADFVRDNGYRNALRGNHEQVHRLNLVLDYLRMEGFAAGIPARNATWLSINRRSIDWHRNFERGMGPSSVFSDLDDTFRWEKLTTSDISMNGYSFREIDMFGDLREEGERMEHCVATYVNSCAKREYAVFHVTGPDEKATLGVRFIDCVGHMDQVQGPRNSQVSSALRKACEEFITTLNTVERSLAA